MDSWTLVNGIWTDNESNKGQQTTRPERVAA